MSSIAPLRSVHLEPIGDLSDDTRDYLIRRMQNHGRATTDLLMAVVLMDYETTQKMAERVSAPPIQGAKWQEQEQALHQQFPETFFDIERDLHLASQKLSQSAHEKNSQDVAENYSSLVSTCVDCHSLFTRRVPPR